MENLKQQHSFLKGKKVVVMGGSSGIGLATAIAAAHEGAHVCIVSSSQHNIDKALKELPAGSKGFAVNLTSEAQIKTFFEQLGAFDHLVFTAGETLQLNVMADTDIHAAKQFFELRYWGAFTAVKYAAPHIKPGGSIVLTGGVAGMRPGKGWALGASICNAMEGFTRAMAVELSPTRVNSLVPGIVKTNLWSNIPDADREAMYANTASNLPVRYVAGAEDLALTYLHLMQQPYMTGQSVVVDGGYVLQ